MPRQEEGQRKSPENEGSHSRLLSILSLFSIEKPSWTAEEAAVELDVSITTSYRYFKSLSQIGLITSQARGAYMLGPAIIEWDRQIQICDPMLSAARGVMLDLIQYAAEGSMILLCRRFRDRVLCVHQVFGRGPQEPVSYERGRPMPLLRGATSKIILAYLPGRELKSLYAANAKEIAKAALGRTREEFTAALKEMRRASVCISHGEVDRDRVGIAAPIFDKDGAILGSLTFVLPEKNSDEHRIARLLPLTITGAHEIERAMGAGDAAPEARIEANKPTAKVRRPRRSLRG